jgi:tetratricopeptide (TPR) repeat protein
MLCRRRPLLLVTLLLLLLPAQALAQGAPPAGQGTTMLAPVPKNDPCLQDVLCKGHYLRARNFSKAGEYQTALDEYELALRQQPVPWLVLNIARTLHKLGKLPEAIDKYQRFLEMTPSGDTELRTKAQESLAQAEKEQTEKAPPPPPLVTEPPPVPLSVTPVTPVVVAAVVPPPKRDRPLYKKWWFWTILGGAVVTGAVIGAAVAVQSQSGPDLNGIVVHDQRF